MQEHSFFENDKCHSPSAAFDVSSNVLFSGAENFDVILLLFLAWTHRCVCKVPVHLHPQIEIILGDMADLQIQGMILH